MQTIIGKWGNSLALRLPQSLASDLRIAEGAAVTLSVEDHALVVKPVRKKLRLSDLLEADRANKVVRSAEVDWGGPQGGEVW